MPNAPANPTSYLRLGRELLIAVIAILALGGLLLLLSDTPWFRDRVPGVLKIALFGAVVGGAYGYFAKRCLREIPRKPKNGSETD